MNSHNQMISVNINEHKNRITLYSKNRHVEEAESVTLRSPWIKCGKQDLKKFIETIDI